MLHDTSRPTQNDPRHTDQSKQANTFIRNWLDRMLFETKTPTFQRVVVTPEIAQMMLARNTSNRRVSDKFVADVSNQMKRGDFRDTPQPISFDWNGRLLDGQHRLMAIIDANVDIPLRVFFGEDPDIMSVMDTGRKRTSADALTIIGVEWSTDIAAAVRVELAIASGIFYKAASSSISTKQIVDAITKAEFAPMKEAVRLKKYINGNNSTLRTNSGVAAAFFRIMKENAFDKVEEFAHQITYGLNIESQFDPVARLRNRLLQSIPNTVETAAIVIKVWNARAIKSPIRNLSWREGEKFPTMLALAG